MALLMTLWNALQVLSVGGVMPPPYETTHSVGILCRRGRHQVCLRQLGLSVSLSHPYSDVPEHGWPCSRTFFRLPKQALFWQRDGFRATLATGSCWRLIEKPVRLKDFPCPPILCRLQMTKTRLLSSLKEKYIINCCFAGLFSRSSLHLLLFSKGLL